MSIFICEPGTICRNLLPGKASPWFREDLAAGKRDEKEKKSFESQPAKSFHNRKMSLNIRMTLLFRFSPILSFSFGLVARSILSIITDNIH